MTAQAKAITWANLTPDCPMDKIERRRIIGQNVMISQVILEAGFSVPAHQHDNEQIAVIVSGRIRFDIGTPGSPEHHQLELTGGDSLHLPPNVLHSAEAIERTVVLDVFSPPSESTGVDRA